MSDEKVERWTIWNEHHPEEATVEGPYASGIEVVPASALARVERENEAQAAHVHAVEARAEKAEARIEAVREWGKADFSEGTAIPPDRRTYEQAQQHVLSLLDKKETP